MSAIRRRWRARSPPSLKTVNIEVRPIHHRCAHRVRAHLFQLLDVAVNL
jgi:hypothetical protein